MLVLNSAAKNDVIHAISGTVYVYQKHCSINPEEEVTKLQEIRPCPKGQIPTCVITHGKTEEMDEARHITGTLLIVLKVVCSLASLPSNLAASATRTSPHLPYLPLHGYRDQLCYGVPSL